MNVMVMVVVVVITMSMCSHVLGTRLSTLSEEGERMLRSCGDCRRHDPPKKPCCPPHAQIMASPAMNTSFILVSAAEYVEVTSEGHVLRSCGDCRRRDPPKEPCCPPHAMATSTKLPIELIIQLVHH